MPSKAELRRQWEAVEKDTVVLHMFNRSAIKPNASPYVMKLETFMRMADIKYIEDFEQPFGGKGKTPWITFNKEDVTDSQLCIEFLGEKLGKDLDKNLSSEERAISRAFRIMLEEHYGWIFAAIQFTHANGKYMKTVFPKLPIPGPLQNFVFAKIVVRNLKSQAHAQGTGRHSKDEVERIGLGHLRALSDYLGKKPFFFGNEPTLLDCVFFSFAHTFLVTAEDDPIIFKKKVEEEMVNLKEHFKRMKEKYWPDWDEKLYLDPRQKKGEREDGDKSADEKDKEGDEQKKE